MEDDIFSTTNVSLLEEVESPRRLVSSPVPFIKKKNDILEDSSGSQKSDILQSSNSSEQWNVIEAPPETLAKSTNLPMPLKHKENTVDTLKKENFDLRLKIYFLEARLHDLSPSNLENALKENVQMKVTAQKLTQELKKYKKIILELNAALEIVNKPCPKQHGMTQEEKDELEAAVSEAEKYHEKNDKLSKMVADISAENVRLRDALRSAKSEHEETDLSRKYRQAQITIQEQQQQIQALQSKSGKPKTQDSYLLSRVKGLEEELKGQRIENDAMINDIEQKKKAMKDLQQELNENSIKLFDAKQHLKSKTAECEKLAKKIASHGKPVDESTDHLIQENKLLFADLQSREKEIAALEDEIIKLLSFYEGDNPVKPIDNEKLTMLESMIQERDGRISELTDEITTLNKSHYQDIKDLEKHLSKIQIEIQEKNEANTHLMTELKNSLEKQNQIQKEYEEKLEKQFNDLAVAIRERDVKIATLEGEREAQEDTVEREKEFLKEEIDDLNNRIDLALQELEEKDRHTLELKDIIAERKGDNSEISRLKEELQKLARIDEEWKERTSSLNNELDDKLDAYRTLKQEWEKTKEKNEILNKMLKAAEDNMKSNKVEQRFQKLNIELRKNLEEKSKDFDRVKAQLHDIQTLYNEQVELNDELEKRLRKRENMLSHSLSTFDTMKEHKEFVENILYEQATGTHSFRERSELSVTKY